MLVFEPIHLLLIGREGIVIILRLVESSFVLLLSVAGI